MRKYLLLSTLVAIVAAGCSDGPGDVKPNGEGGKGNGKTESGAPVIEWAKAQPKVLIEAEIAVPVKPFVVGKAAEASGGKYLTLPAKNCSGSQHQHIAKEGTPERVAGSAELEFSVEKDADYLLWVRKYSCCSCGDSWAMQIDGGKPFTFGNQGTTHKHWSWLAHRGGSGKIKIKLKKGKHKLKILNRGESGFRLDQILFWADTKQVPQGIEKPAPKR